MTTKAILNQAKALSRTRRRLRYLNDWRIYNLEQCPYCLEIPDGPDPQFGSWLEDQDTLRFRDKHKLGCGLPEELGDE